MSTKVLGAAIGPCVHVAGLDHFLRICEEHGWHALSLGPAVPLSVLFNAIEKERPDVVAVSYRLTADDVVPLLNEIILRVKSLMGLRPRWVFGGTPPVGEKARQCGLFSHVFDGTEPSGALDAFFRGEGKPENTRVYPSDLPGRITHSFPMPLIRHHYGEPDLERTIAGAGRIAESEALDVLSIGPDQNAQEHFFNPLSMDPSQHGAGGVPLRKAEDLSAIYEATRTGNHPLVRCYSGTRDLIPWAEMSLRTIHIAWGAIPLCWYSPLDGRSKVPFPDVIQEKQLAMRFYAEHQTPVEVNESHQWSLRDAHDALAVAMAFLGAYNARQQGVRHYVIQLMHNTPPSTSPAMDLAKMLAKLALISELEGPDFTTYREVRAGITSLPTGFNQAKGHMAASAIYAMALKPHILHVVGFSEAYQVVDPDVLIESCEIARGAIRLALQGAPDPQCDPAVQARKAHLIQEARCLLEGLRKLGTGSPDPWSDPAVLTRAIQLGILDVPHFRGNPNAKGAILTMCINGGWEAIDPATRQPVSEKARLSQAGVSL